MSPFVRDGIGVGGEGSTAALFEVLLAELPFQAVASGTKS